MYTKWDDIFYRKVKMFLFLASLIYSYSWDCVYWKYVVWEDLYWSSIDYSHWFLFYQWLASFSNI